MYTKNYGKSLIVVKFIIVHLLQRLIKLKFTKSTNLPVDNRIKTQD